MFNHEVKPHLPWASAPMVLYHHQQAHVSDQQAARFAGTFSIRSILSETRSHPEMGSKYQDHRYLGGVPATYSQPQVVCCNEDANIHLQNHTRNSMPSHTDGTLDTFETTKLQGCLGSTIGKVRPRKGNKRSRTIFTPFQLQRLEKAFERQQYVAGEERRQLAIALNLTETQVKVWFQNRRIRFRKQRINKTAPTT